MGCFNGTCSLSNLPIFAGEKIVLIPLMKTIGKAQFNCCYATDNFTPLGFPIIGEYNDYGGIENATTDKNNKDFLYSLSYFYEDTNPEECEGYLEIDKSENFDDFINETFCCHNCYVQGDDFSFHPNGLSEISFMMIHYNLYERITNEIGNRIPYGKDGNYKTLCKEKYLTYLVKNRKILETSQEIVEETKKIVDLEEKANTLMNLSIKNIILDIANSIFCCGNFLNREKWIFFSNILLFKKDDWETVLDKAVEKLVFTTALNYMRKGYLCDSGAGSQCEETRLHVILADFIKEHVSNYAKQYNCELTDEEDKMDENGTATMLFF